MSSSRERSASEICSYVHDPYDVIYFDSCSFSTRPMPSISYVVRGPLRLLLRDSLEDGATVVCYSRCDRPEKTPRPLHLPFSRRRKKKTMVPHESLNYSRSRRCQYCGINAANGYSARCRHGGLCVICLVATRECLRCSREVSIVRRWEMVSQRDKEGSDTAYIAQPCGHSAKEPYDRYCSFCECPVVDYDLVTSF